MIGSRSGSRDQLDTADVFVIENIYSSCGFLCCWKSIYEVQLLFLSCLVVRLDVASTIMGEGAPSESPPTNYIGQRTSQTTKADFTYARYP